MEPATTGNARHSLLMECFTDELENIYGAEEHLVKTLDKMAVKATTCALAHAFKSHCNETKEQVTRRRQVFEMIGEEANARECEAMAGISQKMKVLFQIPKKTA